MQVITVVSTHIPLLILYPFLHEVQDVKLWHDIQFDGHLKHQPEASVKYVVGHTDTQVVMFSVGL